MKFLASFALILAFFLMTPLSFAQPQRAGDFVIALPGSPYPGVGPLPQGPGYTSPSGGSARPSLPPPRVETGVPNMPDPSSNPSPSLPGLPPATPAPVITTPAPYSLSILPDGREWGALPIEQQQNLTEVIAREPQLRHLLGRIRARQNGISVFDIQLATRLWLDGRSRRDEALVRALERTLMTPSGVIKVLPGSTPNAYRTLDSNPATEQGHLIRKAANETLALQSKISTFESRLPPADQAILRELVSEMVAVTIFLDHAARWDSTHWQNVYDAVSVIQARALYGAEGAASRLPGAAVGAAIASVLPPAWQIRAAALGVARLVYSAASGEAAASILAFKNRITGPDVADAYRAVGEGVVVLSSILDPTAPLALANLSRSWQSIRGEGYALAVQRITWEARLAETRDMVSSFLRSRSISGGITQIREWIEQMPAYGGEVLRALVNAAATNPPPDFLRLLTQPPALGRAPTPAEIGIQIPAQDRVVLLYPGNSILNFPDVQRQRLLGGVAAEVELARGTTLFQVGGPQSPWYVRTVPAGVDPTMTRQRVLQTPIRVWEGRASPFVRGAVPGWTQEIYIPAQ